MPIAPPLYVVVPNSAHAQQEADHRGARQQGQPKRFSLRVEQCCPGKAEAQRGEAKQQESQGSQSKDRDGRTASGARTAIAKAAAFAIRCPMKTSHPGRSASAVRAIAEIAIAAAQRYAVECSHEDVREPVNHVPVTTQGQGLERSLPKNVSRTMLPPHRQAPSHVSARRAFAAAIMALKRGSWWRGARLASACMRRSQPALACGTTAASISKAVSASFSSAMAQARL